VLIRVKRDKIMVTAQPWHFATKAQRHESLQTCLYAFEAKQLQVTNIFAFCPLPFAF
jgi:hypothetical protein